MTPPLLSYFKTYPDSHCNISDTGKSNQAVMNNLSFYYGNKALMIFTIGWIVFQLYSFVDLSLRPEELFVQRHYFGKIFMPFYPSDILFYSVGIISILLIVSILFYKDSILIRGILSFLILWLNLFRWSFGGQGHPGHLLMLAHLLGIFIAYKEIKKNKNNEEVSKSIEWFYLGILATYFFSGFWKVLFLVYKLILKPNDIHWLDHRAALYNSLIEFHSVDLPIGDHYKWFSYPIIWQLGFLITCFILICSVMAAFRHPLRIWIAFGIILFHSLNIFFFNVVFYTPMFVVACLFFPFEKIFSSFLKSLIPVAKNQFSGRYSNALYERIYENGDVDKFNGFFAYREKLKDKNRFLGGLLFFPLIGTLTTLIWNFKSTVKK